MSAARSADAALRADALSVGYAADAVVADVDLALAPGRTLAVIGTNGSGKSTLLKTLGGLLAPVAGRVEVFGGPPGAQPARVAYMSQNQSINASLPMRAVDVVRMGRYPHTGLFRRMHADDHRHVAEALERTGIESIAHESLRDLSGGQCQRVYLAQALARRPELYLLDEPVSGIDAAGQARVREVFDAERDGGASVVVATHDFAEATRADCVLLVAKRVVAVGAPERVLTREHLLEAFGVSIAQIDGALAHDPQHHRH